MLFCLNPPHSLPFPHWPDGATLPAAAAADVILVAFAPPAPTSPAPGTLQLCADSPAPARWLQTRGHAPRSGSQGTRGRGRARKAPASSRPPLATASRGWRHPGPQHGRAEGWRRRLLPFSPAEPWNDSGTGPKKSRKSCLPPGERSRSSLCLESLHLRIWLQCVPGDISTGQTGRRRRVARVCSAFEGGSRE